MTTLLPGVGQPLFIDLSNRDYKEKSFTKEQIKEKFLYALKGLLPIFEHHNENYKVDAKVEVEINNIQLEKEYLSWLIEDAELVLYVLKNPFDISKYEMLAEKHYSYLYNYERHNITDLDNQDACTRFVEEVKKENDFFETFVSFQLFKYAKFLSFFINNLYSYLCLYYENLNKKYYFRFENLINHYGYYFFRLRTNPYLLMTDEGALDLCRVYCVPLEMLNLEK